MNEKANGKRNDLPDHEGNLSNDEYAPIALRLLISHVFEQTDEVLVPITYTELAEMLGRKNKHGNPYARGLGDVLGRITALINDVTPRLQEIPPFLTTIVVERGGRNRGLPGKGVSGIWAGYDLLSVADKRAKVDGEYQRILRYGSRWNEVLKLTGLELVNFAVEKGGHLRNSGRSGGESESHKALKQHILHHPDLVGAAADWDAQEEFDLRSRDAIDLMFKSCRSWIGVEVKSKVSDNLPSDYERGLYQVVKYKAVLQAQAKVDHPENPPEVKVVLVLEKQMPADFKSLASALDVFYIENINPGTPRTSE